VDTNIIEEGLSITGINSQINLNGEIKLISVGKELTCNRAVNWEKISNEKLKINNFNCFYTNMRSVMNNNKMEELQMMLEAHDIHIIGITESWSHDGIDDAELNINGYTLFRRDRRGGKRGGGVLLYVRDYIAAVNVTEEIIGENESVWIRIKCSKDCSLTVGVCYRSPNIEDQEDRSLLDTIQYFSREAVLIMGDFNHGDIDWDLQCAASTNGEEFLTFINDLFITQHVQSATRGKNILDLVLSTEPDMVEDLEIHCPIANSDHNIIIFKVIYETVLDNNKQNVFNYHKGNYAEINKELLSVDWNTRFQNKNTEEMWKEISEDLLESRSKYIPLKITQKGGYPKWIKKSIKRKINKRNYLWNKFRTYATYENESNYKKSRNQVTASIRKARKQFELQIVEKIKEDPKAFYSYVRNRSKTKVKIGPLKDVDGNIVSDNKGMSAILSEYFSTVFTREDVSNMPTIGNNARVDEGCFIDNIEINEMRIIKAFNELKDNKAAGVDDLNSSFVLGTREGLLKPLEMIFKQTFETGEIPSDWKKANVTSIFKKGSKKEASNYRPVSLTSHVCKLLEKIIKEDLVKYLETNRLILDSQHGFRNQKSCLTNLLEFTQFVGDKIDAGEPVDVIYLDFQKAFDKVPHERLLLKLGSLGVRGRLLNWIRNWLTNRYQRVVISGEESEWVEVTSGVPQGSVLGPVLFVIYINDLDENILSKILKFADDTKLVRGIKTFEDYYDLGEDLSKLYKWSEDWQMSFNLDKCKVMHIGNNNNLSSYSMGGQDLEEVDEERDLGVIINNKFKVDRQCAKVTKKANQVLGLIYRTFACKNKNIMLKLYKSLVRPHLDYCCQAWRPHLLKDINLLERVQKRATRMIEECKDMRYEDRLKELRLTTLETRRVRADLLEVYKIVNKLEGVNERNFFERRQIEGIASGTRGNSCKFFKKRFRVDTGKYIFGNRVVNDWNQLPNCVIQAKTINAFKGKLDTFLANIRGLK